MNETEKGTKEWKITKENETQRTIVVNETSHEKCVKIFRNNSMKFKWDTCTCLRYTQNGSDPF